MNNRIEITNDREGRRLASRLLEVIWPPEVIATLPWKDVVWARPDRLVLNINGQNDVIGHAGIFLRNATFDARPVKIGGVGDVATGLDCRRQGIASEVVREAVREMRDTHGVDSASCFANRGTRRSTSSLDGASSKGEVFVDQPPQGRERFSVTDPFVFDLKIAPRAGILDLCGLPW